MSLVTRNLFQDITVWTAGATDLYGNPTFTRSEIKGRWEDRQQKATDFQGDEILSRAVVYVDTDVGMGDFMVLGIDASLTPPDAAKEVKNFSKIPSLKVNMYQRKVIL